MPLKLQLLVLVIYFLTVSHENKEADMFFFTVLICFVFINYIKTHLICMLSLSTSVQTDIPIQDASLTFKYISDKHIQHVIFSSGSLKCYNNFLNVSLQIPTSAEPNSQNIDFQRNKKCGGFGSKQESSAFSGIKQMIP